VIPLPLWTGTGWSEAVPSAGLTVLPGSFHPLHEGHRTLARVAEIRLRTTVDFELSRVNVDKPGLPDDVIQRRAVQFREQARLWVTHAPTFAEKARLFPRATFVLGFDTALRLIDPRYAGNSISQRDRMLGEFADQGCRFLVGGRINAEGVFCVWEQDAVPAEFRDLFIALQEADFRVDISSTALRAAME
jgi:hypothetical protein